MKIRIGCLWISELHLNQNFHQVYPPLYLLVKPLLFRHWVINAASDVAASGDHAHSHLPELLLRPQDVPRQDNQDALGRLWEVAPQRYPHHHVPHMLLERRKLPTRSGVICVPQLSYIRVRESKITDQWEDPYAIGDHGKWIPLVHSLLDIQEVAGHIRFAHHQSGPVAISVESKPRATRPLELGSSERTTRKFQKFITTKPIISYVEYLTTATLNIQQEEVQMVYFLK